MSTGDLRNNIRKIQTELRQTHYAGTVDLYGLSKGDPAALLPLFHFILLDYSAYLAKHFAGKGYELYGKKDTRFLESVYKLLRDEFNYRPSVSRDQFFSMGFAERKLLMLGDLFKFGRTMHESMARKAVTASQLARQADQQRPDIDQPRASLEDLPAQYYSNASPERSFAGSMSVNAPSSFSADTLSRIAPQSTVVPPRSAWPDPRFVSHPQFIRDPIVATNPTTTTTIAAAEVSFEDDQVHNPHHHHRHHHHTHHHHSSHHRHHHHSHDEQKPHHHHHEEREETPLIDMDTSFSPSNAISYIPTTSQSKHQNQSSLLHKSPSPTSSPSKTSTQQPARLQEIADDTAVSLYENNHHFQPSSSPSISRSPTSATASASTTAKTTLKVDSTNVKKLMETLEQVVESNKDMQRDVISMARRLSKLESAVYMMVDQVSAKFERMESNSANVQGSLPNSGVRKVKRGNNNGEMGPKFVDQAKLINDFYGVDSSSDTTSPDSPHHTLPIIRSFAPETANLMDVNPFAFSSNVNGGNNTGFLKLYGGLEDQDPIRKEELLRLLRVKRIVTPSGSNSGLNQLGRVPSPPLNGGSSSSSTTNTTTVSIKEKEKEPNPLAQSTTSSTTKSADDYIKSLTEKMKRTQELLNAKPKTGNNNTSPSQKKFNF